MIDPDPSDVFVFLFSYTHKQVACGFAYTAAVTRDGSVYTWGAGENGRLGLGDEQDKTTPGHVAELGGPRRAVKEIFAGSVHTCALLENGQVFSWGKCEYTGHGLSQVRCGAVGCSGDCGWCRLVGGGAIGGRH